MTDIRGIPEEDFRQIVKPWKAVRTFEDLDEYVERYADVCDVVERTYQGMPLEHCDMDTWKAGIADNDPLHHTSDAARAAASRIFELLGIKMDKR